MNIKFSLIVIAMLSFANADAIDIRSIEYLEKPDLAELIDFEKIESYLYQEGTLSFLEIEHFNITLFLKHLLNQPGKILSLSEKPSCYKKLMTILGKSIKQESHGLKILLELTKLFANAIEKLISIPNPPLMLIDAKDKFIYLYSDLFSHISPSLKRHFFQSYQPKNNSLTPLAILFLRSKPDLQQFLETFVFDLKEEEKKLFYQELVHSFQILEVHTIFRTLIKKEKIHLLKVLAEASLSSHKAFTALRELLPNLEEDELESLLSLAASHSPHVQNTMFQVFQEFLRSPSLSSIQPGRLGNENIFHTRFGNSDVYFYSNFEKYDQTLAVIDSINKETIIAIDQLSPRSSIRGYVTANKKHHSPLGFFSGHHKAYYDAKGKEFEDMLLQTARNMTKTVFGFNPIKSKMEIHLKLNHDGEKWRPLFAPISPEDQLLKASLGDTYRFVEYTAFDWQLSPGTIAGLLIQDCPNGDRFFIYGKPQDHFSICFIKPIQVTDSHYPYLIETGAVDYQSSFTPGSTKGKTINLYFESIAIKNSDKINNYIEIKKNEPQSLKNIKLYKNGLVFTNCDFELANCAAKQTYYKSSDGVDIFEIEKDAYLKEIANIDCIIDESHTIKRVYRLVKRSQGFSHFSRLDLPIENSNHLIIFNRSSLPKSYQDFPLAENQTTSCNPWIQIYRFPKNTYLKMDKSLFDSLTLTPIEEIFFRDEIEDSNDFDHYRQIERFETVLDVIIFTQ